MTPYPNGWYLAAFSHELAQGEVKRVEMLGRELVLFHTHDGAPHVVEPYCPHMGAHLGHGGKVEGNCIRCPFHSWKYDAASGRCSEIPSGDAIPPNARLDKWRVEECSSMVLVWWHVEGAAPSWSVGTLPNIDEPGWSSWARTDWEVTTSIQDISENDADAAHSPILHDWTDHRPDITMEADGPVFRWRMKVRPTLSALGLPDLLPASLESDVTSTRCGMAIGWITQDLPLGRGVVIRTQTLATTTPLDETRCALRMLHRVRDLRFSPLTKLALKGYAGLWQRTVDQDISIWRHKIYLTQPCASKSDANILQFRRWTRQFYSANEGSASLPSRHRAPAAARGRGTV